MPRIKVDYQFPAEVIDTNHPTQDGNWYTVDTVEQIVDQVNRNQRYIIQEFNPIERQIKKVPLNVVWEDQVMGHCIDAKNVDGKLVMTFKCESNKFGKKLMNICESYGLKNLKIFPVGEGIPVEQDGKKTVTQYKLKYVAFEG